MRELKAQGLPTSKIAKKFGILPDSCKFILDPDSRKAKVKRNKIWRDTHKEQVKESKAREYQKHKEDYRKYRDWYFKENRETILQQNREYNARPENKTRAKKQSHQHKITKTVELKQKIASLNNRPVECFGYPSYGSCSPNGTPETRMERLEFDHIHGGGKKDRISSEGYTLGKYAWLTIQLKLSDKKLREKLQLLCSGCNQEKIRVEQSRKYERSRKKNLRKMTSKNN